MRILHLNFERSWRGGERQTLLLLQGLQQQGHTVALLARAASPLAKRAQTAGITVYEATGTWSMITSILKYASKYQILHAQTSQSFSLLAVLKPLIKAALVFTKRTAFNNKSKPGRQRWKWSKADALVAISNAAAQAVRDLGLVASIIPSAVQTMSSSADVVELLKQKYAIQDQPVIITTAALSREKDPFSLIQAVAILRQTIPDIVCLHCGADGDVAAPAKDLVATLGLEQNYIFTGFQTDIANYLALADVYVSTSTYEALGTSVLDACLAGIPVVATDVGGHKEILNPDYGLLVQAESATAVAKKVSWLLQHDDVATAMAKRAQTMVAQQFSVPVMVQSYISLYKSVLN